MKKTNIERIRTLLESNPEEIANFERFVPDALQTMAKQNLINYCKKSKCEMAELTPEIMARHSAIPSETFRAWLGNTSFVIWLHDSRTLEEIFAAQAERAMRRLADIAHGSNSSGQVSALKTILDYSVSRPTKTATASVQEDELDMTGLSDEEIDLEIEKLERQIKN